MDSGVVTVSVLVSGFGPGEGFVKPVDDLPHLLCWKAETVAERGVGESCGLGGEVGIYYPVMSCGRRDGGGTRPWAAWSPAAPAPGCPSASIPFG